VAPLEQKAIARTPLRLAIALLLQNPEIYAISVEQIDPTLFDDKEHYVLLKLLDKLASNPQANTAILLEAWREDSYFDSINKLAAWDHQVPEEELNREFIDIMLFLQRQNRERLIHQFIDKSRQYGLNESEKICLQNMLALKKK
jgi:DNA primase